MYYHEIISLLKFVKSKGYTLRIFNLVLFITLFSLSFQPLLQSSASAQSPNPNSKSLEQESPPAPINLTISPIFINLVTDPGVDVSSQLRITNNNAFTENFRIDIAKYQVGSGGERINILPLDKNDEFGKWVRFDEQRFKIIPNQTKTIKFTISPPRDSGLGYYYAFIIRRVTEQEGGSNSSLTGAPAFTTILEVRSPNAKRELQLISFSTDKTFYEYLPVNFNIVFKNTGNLHIIPQGNIFIDQGDKKDLAILKINEGQGNILPGGIRTYTASWDDGMLVKVPKKENGQEVRNEKGQIVYETKWDFAKADKFRIGRYKSNLLAVYDNGKRDIPIESRFSFWIFPWKIVLIVLTVILFVLVGLKTTVSSYVKKLRK